MALAYFFTGTEIVNNQQRKIHPVFKIRLILYLKVRFVQAYNGSFTKS